MGTAEERWRELVAEFDQSSSSLQAFAEEHGVSARTLAWWRVRARERRGRPQGGFIELVPATSPPLRVSVRGATIVVDDDTDLALLRRVVEALA